MWTGGAGGRGRGLERSMPWPEDPVGGQPGAREAQRPVVMVGGRIVRKRFEHGEAAGGEPQGRGPG